MRFESVTAHRFGPFRDETLELAPGMNVVFGRNEAGKSSWHAALYAG
ncbi:MAG: AAA family ATPase, partial [Gemmatimonadales bacterium]|nr:AAA family ATPase [Gemmatimonadales bacterium]